MPASWMRLFFALLTFVTVGMIIGALVQLAFIRRLEDSYGPKFSLRRTQSLNGDVSYWGDKEAAALRLGYVKPEVVSWSPRIIVFHNFLSPEECDYLRAIAKPRLQVSTVVDAKTGKKHNQAIEKRISVYCQVPVENGVRIQVLRSTGMKRISITGRTMTTSLTRLILKYGGQRVATMLMYLCDNVEGGETYFPQGLDGQSDPNSLHGGCEVVAGEKWSATKWMRQGATS